MNITGNELNTWIRKAVEPSGSAQSELARLGDVMSEPMRENEKKLLYAIHDATNKGIIEWFLANDGLEFHSVLPGSYTAVMYRDDMYIIDIRNSSGEFINSLRSINQQDRATTAYIYTHALKSTLQSEQIFGEIAESLRVKNEKT